LLVVKVKHEISGAIAAPEPPAQGRASGALFNLLDWRSARRSGGQL
jgi:hypothetical protein